MAEISKNLGIKSNWKGENEILLINGQGNELGYILGSQNSLPD